MNKQLKQACIGQDEASPATSLLQVVQLVSAANEVGKALGWRLPTPEEDEAMSAAADACLRASASNTSIIPGML